MPLMPAETILSPSTMAFLRKALQSYVIEKVPKISEVRVLLELDHVVLGLETDTEGLLEVLDLRCGRLLSLLRLLVDLLGRRLLLSLSRATAGDEPGRRAVGGSVDCEDGTFVSLRISRYGQP